MSTAIKTEESAPAIEWTVEKLKGLSNSQAIELFATLLAPPFSEMDGEYEAALLDQGNPIKNASGKLFLNNPLLFGRWLCKAFTPGDGDPGHGYNSFRKFGKVVRKFRMETRIVPSRFDGKDVFRLYYPAYRSFTGNINMVDEVRKVHEGLYLGLGTWGFSEKQRLIRLPFYLSGPIHEFVGPDREELK